MDKFSRGTTLTACLFFTFLFTSCYQSRIANQPISNEEKEIITKKTDLSKYDKLIEFYKSSICEAEPEGISFYNCMQSYFIQVNQKSESQVLNMALAEQDFMLSKLDAEVLKKIWLTPNFPIQLEINRNNEYFEILTQLSSEIPTIKSYQKSLVNSKSIPRNFTEKLKALDSIHFEDKRLQLIIAAHYFTLNKII